MRFGRRQCTLCALLALVCIAVSYSVHNYFTGVSRALAASVQADAAPGHIEPVHCPRGSIALECFENLLAPACPVRAPEQLARRERVHVFVTHYARFGYLEHTLRLLTGFPGASPYGNAAEPLPAERLHRHRSAMHLHVADFPTFEDVNAPMDGDIKELEAAKKRGRSSLFVERGNVSGLLESLGVSYTLYLFERPFSKARAMQHMLEQLPAGSLAGTTDAEIELSDPVRLFDDARLYTVAGSQLFAPLVSWEDDMLSNKRRWFYDGYSVLFFHAKDYARLGGQYAGTASLVGKTTWGGEEDDFASRLRANSSTCRLKYSTVRHLWHARSATNSWYRHITDQPISRGWLVVLLLFLVASTVAICKLFSHQLERYWTAVKPWG